MAKDFEPSISIEKMAAYLDGNLSSSDMSSIGNIIENDPDLQSMVDMSDLVDSSILSEQDLDFDVLQNIQSVEIPPIDDSLNNIDQDMEKIVIGISGADVKDPIFIEQPDDHSCALKCQQIMMRDYGIDIPFSDLEKLAIENHIYSSKGTLMCDMGKALDLAGVPYHVSEGNTVNDLMRELAQGHRVMVGVDSNELWYNNTENDQLKNKMSDAVTEFFKNVFHVNGGNHALIVAGIEVNPNNPSDMKVVLTDPGDGHFRVTYPAHQFADAWHDSNCLMVATDKPAPYQYDFEHHKMVPSQFAIQEHLNEWVTEHSYQLNPDMINVPDDYTPYYSSHEHTSSMYKHLGVNLDDELLDENGTIDISDIEEASLSTILGGEFVVIDEPGEFEDVDIDDGDF